MFICLLTSCGAEPTTGNRQFTAIGDDGPLTFAKVLMATINCTVAGSNCGDWGGSGDVVTFNRQN